MTWAEWLGATASAVAILAAAYGVSRYLWSALRRLIERRRQRRADQRRVEADYARLFTGDDGNDRTSN